MSARNRCTFKVLMPFLFLGFFYAGAAGATNDRDVSASATQRLNKHHVALRNEADIPRASQVTIEPEAKTSGLNVTHDTQVAQFAEPRSSTPGDFNAPIPRVSTLAEVGEPTLRLVEASPPGEALAAARDGDMPSVIDNDFNPGAWMIGLALLAFVMYSRRRVDS